MPDLVNFHVDSFRFQLVVLSLKSSRIRSNLDLRNEVGPGSCLGALEYLDQVIEGALRALGQVSFTDDSRWEVPLRRLAILQRDLLKHLNDFLPTLILELILHHQVYKHAGLALLFLGAIATFIGTILSLFWRLLLLPHDVLNEQLL